MRDWLVAGAVIEGPDGLLLVENRRRNGSSDWSPPGGVIDPGEAVLDGLAREVVEETGLVVTEWSDPIYEIEVVAPGRGRDRRPRRHRRRCSIRRPRPVRRSPRGRPSVGR